MTRSLRGRLGPVVLVLLVAAPATARPLCGQEGASRGEEERAAVDTILLPQAMPPVAFLLPRQALLRGIPRVTPPRAPGAVPPSPLQQEPPDRISPGGAFLRSLIVPGWGHAATGSYTRGGFYFMAQSGTAWMLVRTGANRNSARAIRDLRSETAEARFLAEGVHPDSIPLRVQADPGVASAQALVDARSQQFEDWAALGIFLVLIGAADAFVAGHLQDFPTPLSIRAVPAGPLRAAGSGVRPTGRFDVPGAVEIRLSLPWHGPWSGLRE
ncbi:MAG: hypothetical protein WDZ89_04420 [Gemmatimonadota bacterium]